MNPGSWPTKITYEGLGATADTPGPWALVGTPLGVTLDGLECEWLALIARMREEVAPQGEREALARAASLVDERAQQLPLPDGCLVIPYDGRHRRPWSDVVSVLAVLSKVSATVWLRAKLPSLEAGLERGRASLLLPPGHTLLTPVRGCVARPRATPARARAAGPALDAHVPSTPARPGSRQEDPS